MMANTLPLSIRDVSPGEGAERLTGTRADGLPDWVHTGGAWLHRGEVWKPLDGRPWVNSDCHVPTLEAEFLEAVAGQPFFPRNWRVEEVNGRRFLVRPFARILEPKAIDDATLLALAQAVREVNAQEWEIGDLLQVGEIGGVPFVVDLSTVHVQKGICAYAADDGPYLQRFFALAGREALWERLESERRAALFHELGWDDVLYENPRP